MIIVRVGEAKGIAFKIRYALFVRTVKQFSHSFVELTKPAEPRLIKEVDDESLLQYYWDWAVI